MTEKPTESAPEPVESQELPTPEISPTSADQQPSTGQDRDALVSALKEALLPELEERIARQTQSVKDRRLGKFDKRLGEIESVLADYQQLVEGGASPESATDKMLLRKMAELLEDKPASPAQPGKLNSETMRTARGILREFGLSENDSEVLQLFSGRYTSDTDFIAKLSTFAAKRQVASNRPASPATVAAPGGGAPGASDQDTLRQQYETEKSKLRRGSPAYMNLRRKYADLGLSFRQEVK